MVISIIINTNFLLLGGGEDGLDFIDCRLGFQSTETEPQHKQLRLIEMSGIQGMLL